MLQRFTSEHMYELGRDGEHDVSHSGLFVSLLLRYPEIGSVKYLPASGCLVMGFMLHQVLSKEAFLTFSRQLHLSLELYSELSGRAVHMLDVKRTNFAPFCTVEVIRDIDTLTPEELSLIVGVVRNHYEESLIYELVDTIGEEELQIQDDMIEHMLDDVRQVRPPRDLVGFRDHGRVVVRRGERKP